MPARSLEFTFSKDVTPKAALTNFWPPEDGFVWSAWSWSEISFDVPIRHGLLDSAAELTLDLDVFHAPPDLEGQNVRIYVNGLRLATRYIAGRMTIVAELPAGWLRESGNLITIDTPDAASPSDHGEADSRKLGIKLFSIAVRGA